MAGAVCAVIPDLDVIGLRLGIHSGDFWGHRGFTHSLVFAALMAGFLLVIAFRTRLPEMGRIPLTLYLFLATASHSLLDAMTNGGLGIPFFLPFSYKRYFFPWRPIHVSPISVVRFFTPRAYGILESESLWVWVPAVLLSVLALSLRRKNEKAYGTDLLEEPEQP